MFTPHTDRKRRTPILRKKAKEKSGNKITNLTLSIHEQTTLKYLTRQP